MCAPCSEQPSSINTIVGPLQENKIDHNLFEQGVENHNIAFLI